jgi:membrane protein
VGTIWKRLKKTFVVRVLSRYAGRNGPNQATLIAWNLLFAIFPIIILAVTLAGLVFRDPAAGREVAKAVASVLPKGRGSVVLQALQKFHRDSGWLAIVGILGLIWSGTSLFGAMDHGFAALSGGKSRSFLPQKLMSVGMIVLFTVLAVPVVLSSSLLAGLEKLGGLPTWLHSGYIALILQIVVAVIVGTILFTAIYSLVPHQRRRLGASLLGGAAAGLIFEALSLAFPLYFRLEHGFSTYGSTFGLFFLILAYAFLVAQITVLGYAVTVEADPAEPERPGPGQEVSNSESAVPSPAQQSSA